ncbi:MAG: SGNH/GDSL hydrolase family protein [Acidimicrobiales bacterium]
MTEYDVVSWPTVVEQFRPDVVLTEVSPWDVTDRRIPGLNGDDWTHVGEPVYDDYARSEYAAAIETLTAGGATLYILEGAPLNRPLAPQNSPERIAALNAIVADVAASAGEVRMVDFPAWIGPVGSEIELSRRRDGVHLSDAGVEEVIPWLLGDVLGLLS